jgi:hypothetical protein
MATNDDGRGSTRYVRQYDDEAAQVRELRYRSLEAAESKKSAGSKKRCTRPRYFGTTGATVEDPDFVCSNCGGPVRPFGTMRHWFALDEKGSLCLECARELVPERVKIAEAWEQRWNQTDGEKQH